MKHGGVFACLFVASWQSSFNDHDFRFYKGLNHSIVELLLDLRIYLHFYFVILRERLGVSFHASSLGDS